MRRLTRPVVLCSVLLLTVFGTLSNNLLAPRAQDQDDPACRQSCFLEFQTCYFAALGSKSAGNKCLAAYKHCVAQCK
jgi:hypothetical protein